MAQQFLGALMLAQGEGGRKKTQDFLQHPQGYRQHIWAREQMVWRAVDINNIGWQINWKLHRLCLLLSLKRKCSRLGLTGNLMMIMMLAVRKEMQFHHFSTISWKASSFQLKNVFSRLCETHYINIYAGPTTSDDILEELCGFRQREIITYEDGNDLLVEFR